MNEWVPVKGCILGIWTDGPYVVNIISDETLHRYDYTLIHVVCWVELPEQKRLCPIFFENMDPDKWDTTV